MANTNLFQSYRGQRTQPTDTINHAGGVAYSLEAEQALAQFAATGCFGNTYYTSAGEQLDDVLKLAEQCSLEFVAQCAIYSREKGYMKDMPAFLVAYLTSKGPEGVTLAGRIFNRVIDNGKMLRNFVQIVRSGLLERKSFGTAPKRFIRNWLESRTNDQLFRDSVGNNPSLADVIKMVHPKPTSNDRSTLYNYIIGKPYDLDSLYGLAHQYETYKVNRIYSDSQIPDVPFQMLTSLDLGTKEWTEIAKNAKWQMTRINLNTFARHGVFENQKMVNTIANRLANPDLVRKARVFPYQLLTAYKSIKDVPSKISEALQDAMETAIENVPELPGNVVICPDVSGSMSNSVTGDYRSSTKCVDVAALFTAAILRRNRNATVIPFADELYDLKINPRDTVMTISRQIRDCCGGGTYCSLPMKYINKNKMNPDLVIYISDNESWMDTERQYGYGSREGTALAKEWSILKTRNKNAKLICIDITPNRTSQVQNGADILNIGGFSDFVFNLIAMFADKNGTFNQFVKVIKETKI